MRNMLIALAVLAILWFGTNVITSQITEPVPPATGDTPSAPTNYPDMEAEVAYSADLPEDLKTLSSDNTQFAFELYHALKHEDGNLFYSPYSISTALAMTYAGARGETEKEMSKTLHFSLPQDKLHKAFTTLAEDLAAREGLELSIANSLWGQQGYPFLPEFLKEVEDGYGSGLQTVDFVSDPEVPRKAINDWVAQKTKDRIQDLIPKGGLTENTRLVLANAIYFNATWQTAFDPARTKEEQFILLDRQKQNVPMMSQQNTFGYRKGENYQVVSLPYNGDMSFVALMPDEGKFAEVEAKLNTQFFDEAISQVYGQEVILKMPKFEFDSAAELVKPMKALEMKTAFAAFDPDAGNCRTTYKPEFANFSGMDGSYCLYISAIFHKAYVKVEEKGTEAAAATAVVETMPTSEPALPIELTLDHPFIFFIRDNQTGSILFVGRVLNPLE